MFCQECGTELAQAVKFCGNCGAAQRPLLPENSTPPGASVVAAEAEPEVYASLSRRLCALLVDALIIAFALRSVGNPLADWMVTSFDLDDIHDRVLGSLTWG